MDIFHTYDDFNATQGFKNVQPAILIHLAPKKFDLFDSGISLETWSPAVHVEYLTSHGTIIGAIPFKGVIERNLDLLQSAQPGQYCDPKDGHHIEAYEIIGATAQTYDLIEAAMAMHIGASYDWMGDLSFLPPVRLTYWIAYKICGWKYKPYRVGRLGKVMQFCSMVMFASCIMGGYTLLNNIADYQVSPAALRTSPLIRLRTHF